MKLLGAPELPSHKVTGFGPKLANLTQDLLHQWNCMDNIRAMVFDTTAANTGHLSAACISVQERLGRQLLWCPSRHHIVEIILSRVWKALNVEQSRSPEISVFARLRSSFHLISALNPNEQYCKFNSEDEGVSNIIEYCQHLLQQNFCREDYQELLKLVLLYLGSACSSSYKILQPGTIHNARWMSKIQILTSLKLMLLKDKIDLELPKNHLFASNQQRDKIRQFVRFVVFVYLPFWYIASCAVDVPVIDLELRTRINHHKNDQTKKAATKAFENHIWYLSEELILLSLFSSKVTD